MYNYSPQPDADQLHLQRQLGQHRRWDVQLLISSPTLTNGTFSGNSATYGRRRDVQHSSSPTLTNVTFSGNSAITAAAGCTTTQQQPDADQRHLQRQLGPMRRRMYNAYLVARR